MVQEAALALAGRAAVVQINTEESRLAASRFDIRGIPAVVLLRGSKEVARTSGAMDRSRLLSWLAHNGVR